MSEATPEPSGEIGFFQAGGTLQASVRSYIERGADKELYRAIKAGEFCYVLTPRQMGKSSLMTHVARRLRNENVRVAVVDLTQIGGDKKSITADQWYYGLAHRLLKELGSDLPLAQWWQIQARLSPLNRLTNFFEEGILDRIQGPVVVFVDEIDTTINLPFSDDFFAAIRACFNARANDGRYSWLSFILLGVASPADLIRDSTRTPFNIGKRIDLNDFSSEQARHFLQGFHEPSEQAERLLQRILYWSGGHPYLTQRLCEQLQKTPQTDETPDLWVDRLVAEAFLGTANRSKEDHLKTIHERIAQAQGRRAGILKLYAKVLKGKPVQDQPQSPIHAALKLSGLVKADEQGRLVVRNRIYQKVFDARWVKSLRPSRWKQGSVLASAVLAAIVFGWWIGAQQLTVRTGASIVLAWLGIAYPEPEMLEIPAGSFVMGSPDDEKGRSDDEGPRHTVDIARFALGKYEVTFDEYDVFAFLINGDGGCRDGHEVRRPDDEGWGRERRPAINVSWQDAVCHAEWLSRKTGKRYRLPTEAEWEYAARAGTQTPRFWPDGINTPCEYANVLNENSRAEIKKRYSFVDWEAFQCPDGYAFTAPVGRFKPNGFGLYDMLGNMWEWTQDCWHDSYKGAPADGAAWLEAKSGYCGLRVMRGGSWYTDSANVRAATRLRYFPDNRFNFLGFRLAQDL